MQYQIESILRVPAAPENPVLPRRKVAWLRMCQIASERGLDPFLSTSYRCLDGRFNWQIAHGRIRVYIGKGSKNSLTWKLQTPT